MNIPDPTVRLDSEPSDGVSLEELKKRLNAEHYDSISRFDDLHLLGLGGVAEILSGRDKILNREVAIKVLRPGNRNTPALVDGFIREAQATAQISHPNIVPVHEMGVFDDAGLYFTMKKVSGETLRSLIERLRNKDREAIKAYSGQRMLEIFIAAGQAVAYAHSRGVIHCDLKPGNIMLGEYGETLVMDWGLVQNFNSATDNDNRISLSETSTSADPKKNDGVSGGTPAFMAPEMFTGQVIPNPKTDQYALGCILYCILTNSSSPFPSGLSMETLADLVVRGRFVRPRKRARHMRISADLEAICLKAMSADPDKRYPDITSMLKDVRNYLDNRPVSAKPPGIARRFFKLCLRNPFIPVSTITAIVVSFFVYMWWNQKIMSHLANTNYMLTEIIRNGNLLYLKAINVANDKTHDKYRQNDALLFLGSDFNYFYTRAFEQLISLSGMDAFDENHKNILDKIFDKQICFARTTRHTLFLERFCNMLVHLRASDLSSFLDDHPEKRQILELVINYHGIITITCPESVSATLISAYANTKPTAIHSGQPVTLPAGEYKIKLEENGKSAIVPVYLYPGCEEKYVFDRIPSPVPGCVPVIHPLKTDAAFHISRTEVSGDEYAAFLSSLPAGRVRDTYAAGVIIEPGNLPVRGVTKKQADGYCEYLSSISGRKVRLPSRDEWLLATWGAPEYFARQIPDYSAPDDSTGVNDIPMPVAAKEKDISPYGVYDMKGNVRELVDSRLNHPDFTITCGGSWLVPEEYRYPEFTGDASAGGNDVGFRYVLEEY